jgi:4,5-DOPA dioxygenase extradiol
MIGSQAKRMPCLFLGHGTPLNVLADNIWTRAWRRIALGLPRPRAILSISAHWCTRGVGVTAMEAPPTIHDFGGFPKEMYDIRYPAPGDPALAARIAALLAPLPIVLDHSWGFDHGTWSVLAKAYPEADIPVVQLSIDMTQPPAFHFSVGAHLAPLRDEGVLILGSGNIVHNLMLRQRHGDFAYGWAIKFNDFIRDSLLDREFDALVDYERIGEAAALSAPTPDHYYPLLYAAGAAAGDEAAIEIDGVYEGAMSMMSVVFGKAATAA